MVKARLNCEWLNRDGEIWFKSTRAINAGEEFFTQYTLDNLYWTVQYTTQQNKTDQFQESLNEEQRHKFLLAKRSKAE